MSGLKKSRAIVILIVFSMMLSLLAANIVNAGTSLTKITETQSDEYVEITRTVSKTKVLLNEEVTITYTIKPKDIPVVSQPIVKKEIMLVVDASNSMINYDISPNKTRLKGAQEAAKSFIDTLAAEADKHPGSVKTGMIKFNSVATVKEYGSKILTDNFAAIKTDIGKLNDQVAQGTNIGDALRRAYYELKKGDPDAEKYIVLLSDGEASYFSGVKYKKWNYWGWYSWDRLTNISGKLAYFTADGNSYQEGGVDYEIDPVQAFWNDYKTEKNEYCYVIADMIKNYNNSNTKKMKPLMIAYGSDADKAVLEETVNRAGGSASDVYDAQSSEALEEVFITIKDEIVKDYSLNNINFEEELPEGFTVTAELGFDINPPAISKSISAISYKLNAAKTLYTADPITFHFTVKCGKAGTNIFGGATFKYDSITGSTETIDFSAYTIHGYQNQAPITINRTITPKDGILDSAIVSKYTINPGSFTVDPDPYDGVLPATLTVSGVELHEKLPDGLKLPDAIPGNFAIDADNNITATLPPIVYTKNAADQYVASDIIMELPIIPTEVGTYHWEGEIAYVDVDGLPKTKSYDGEASITEYGTPAITVTKVVKRGEVVDVTVNYTLPDFTASATITQDGETPITLGTGTSGTKTFTNLSIYEDHKATITSTSVTSINRQVEILIYDGINVN